MLNAVFLCWKMLTKLARRSGAAEYPKWRLFVATFVLKELTLLWTLSKHCMDKQLELWWTWQLLRLKSNKGLQATKKHEFLVDLFLRSYVHRVSKKKVIGFWLSFEESQVPWMKVWFIKTWHQHHTWTSVCW